MSAHEPFESLEPFEIGACIYQAYTYMLARVALRVVFEGSSHPFECCPCW